MNAGKKILPQSMLSALGGLAYRNWGPYFQVLVPLLMMHGAYASKTMLVDPMCENSFFCTSFFYITGGYTLIMCLWSYWRASFTNPGVVPVAWAKWDGSLATRPPIPTHGLIADEWLQEQAKEVMAIPEVEVKVKRPAAAPAGASSPASSELDSAMMDAMAAALNGGASPKPAPAAQASLQPPPFVSSTQQHSPAETYRAGPGGGPAPQPVQAPQQQVYEAESVIPGFELTITPEMKDPHPTRYCNTCRVYKPPRTHHCSKCNRCVLKLDHHCAWLNTCVGRWNHKFFFQACVFMRQATMLYVLACAVGVLKFLYNMVREPHVPAVTGSFFYLTIMLVLDYLVFKWMDHLVEHQKMSMHLGVTRIEESFDPPHLKGRYHAIDPWTDYTNIMGTHWTHWLLPIDPFSADDKARELEGRYQPPFKMPNGGTLLFNHAPDRHREIGAPDDAADQLNDLFGIEHGHSHDGPDGCKHGHGESPLNSPV